MNKDYNINLKSKKSNNLILKILVTFTFFSYLLLSMQNNEISKYLYENHKRGVATSVSTVYYLAVLLFAILSYYGMKYEIYNNSDNVRLLINLGLKRGQLYKILLRSISLEIILGFIIGLPLGIFSAEIIDLLSILVLDLDIRSHRINLDPRAIGLSFILLISFVLIALFIITIIMGKKYQEKTDGIKLSSLIVQFILISAYIYYLNYNYFINFKLIILFISIDIFLEFIIFKILRASNSYNYENSLLLSHVNQGKVIFLFILIALSTSLANLYMSISEINHVMTDSNSRPHFTVFEDSEVIDKLKDEYKDIISEIYPLNMLDYKGIDDRNFKNAISKVIDMRNGYSINTPWLMNYSTYKNVYRDRAVNLNSEDESIYLYSNLLDRTSYPELNKYLEVNELLIKIDGKDFKIKAVDRSDIIYANDHYTKSFIYVVNDEIFEKLAEDYNPIIYNLNISEEYLDKYGKNYALENIRSEFFKRNIKFESLIWMIKNNYGSILTRQFILMNISILLLLISGFFLAINVKSFFNNKSSDFITLSLLGKSNSALKDLRKHHTIKIYCLMIALSLINYMTYIYIFQSSSPDGLYTRSRFYQGSFYVLIPIVLIILMFITARLVLTKEIDYE